MKNIIELAQRRFQPIAWFTHTQGKLTSNADIQYVWYPETQQSWILGIKNDRVIAQYNTRYVKHIVWEELA